MSTEHSERTLSRTWLRIGLLFVAAAPLVGGFWALLFPRAFYDDFPLPGSAWVSTLGPYNEHLLRDYGALNLAMAVLLLAAGILLERRLVQVALITWLVFEVPHFIFHLGQTHHFSSGSNLAQLGGLAFQILLPLILLFLLPQKATGRDLRHANVNRTERLERSRQGGSG
jgi:hypothetical protein